MLNTNSQIVHEQGTEPHVPMTPIELEEKIDWNEHANKILSIDYGQGPSYDAHSHSGINIRRNLRDNTFDIVGERALRGDSFHPIANFLINDKVPDGVIENGLDLALRYSTVHRSAFGNIPLDKTTMISYSESYTYGRDSITATSVTLFPEIEPMNKKIYINDNQYIDLRSINTARFSLSLGFLFMKGALGLIRNIPLITDKTYNHTYIVPVKLHEATGNQTLFEIYSSNDDKDESTYADFGKGDGKVTTSSSKSSLTTHFIPETRDIERVFGKVTAKKVGSIQVFDSSIYNYETRKTEIGYGELSESGIMIPYDFSGEYKEHFVITPNAAFKDLNIYMSHKVKTPLLNKYSGKVILNVEESPDKIKQELKIIKSKNVEKLIDNDPSIAGLERLSY